MPPECAAHPDRAAVYECDSCGRQLCEECIEEGHRLLFCRHCGERALPLVAGMPATTGELEQERKRTAPYSFADSLAYPFRGLGLYLFVGYVGLLFLFHLVGWIPGIGCLVLLFQGLILLILPGFLFAIVGSSAEGETELPDWPDFSEVGERVSEWLWLLLILMTVALPGLVVLRLGNCSVLELFFEGWQRSCWLLGAAGVVIGFTLSVPAVGAVGTYQSGWLGPRIDLHVKALVAVRDDAWRTIALLTGLWLASQLLKLLFMFVPLLGVLSQIAVAVYTLFIGAHLIGLLFRRNAKMLEAIYLGT